MENQDLELKKSSASVELTKEAAEKIEEGFRKLEEKFAEKQKAFSFHGTEAAKAELEVVSSAKDANAFIRAIARGDAETAAEFSDRRAKSLNYGKRDFLEQNIATKTITAAGSAGSEYLVPSIFETEILATFDTYNKVIGDADIKDYNLPGNIFNLNELDTRVVVWASDEDSTGLTSSQPTYSQPQIGITDWIGATDITMDFMEDTEVDIMSNLSRQFGEEMAKKLEARLINGDVTVSGVVTKGLLNTSGVNQVFMINTASGYTGIQANDIEAMFFSAISIASFQDANQEGVFYMNGTALYNLRANIRSASSDRDYLSIFDPVAMTLMGRPLKITNQFPTPTTTVSNPFVVYGNLKNHLKIRRKRGITMKLNDQGTTRGGRNLNYQLGRELVVSQRIGHQVVLADGLTVLHT